MDILITITAPGNRERDSSPHTLIIVGVNVLIINGLPVNEFHDNNYCKIRLCIKTNFSQNPSKNIMVVITNS